MRKDELEKFVIDSKVDNARKDERHRICGAFFTLSASAIMSVLYMLGDFIYTKWQPLQIAIKAYLEADK